MSKLGPDPLIHPGAMVEDCRLGRFVEIGAGARLAKVEMGDYSYTDRFSDIANAKIGRFASIAAFTRVNPGDHPIRRASAHHFTYRAGDYWADAADEPAFFEWRRAQACEIGHDAWLGHGAILLAGRKLGVGAVAGAGAVVAHDVAPYAIVAGTPAREIGRRFEPRIVERLLALSWWDWSHGALRAALQDFRELPVEAFLERYEAGPPSAEGGS